MHLNRCTGDGPGYRQTLLARFGADGDVAEVMVRCVITVDEITETHRESFTAGLESRIGVHFFDPFLVFGWGSGLDAGGSGPAALSTKPRLRGEPRFRCCSECGCLAGQ